MLLCALNFPDSPYFYFAKNRTRMLRMGLAKVGPELNLEEDASFEANRIGNASVAALFQD